MSRYCNPFQVTVLAGLAFASAASAQFTQYTVPGSLGAEVASAKQAMDKSVAEAPWHIGKVRLQPYIGLKDLGYVENLRGNDGRPIDDFTATLGLGLKAYLPMGPKSVLAAHYLPEYTWWRDSKDLRGWHLRSGVGWYGFFNHVKIEAKGTATDLLDYVTSEFDSPAVADDVSLGLDAKVDLWGPWGFFVGGGYSDVEYDDTGVERVFQNQLELLDRNERNARFGLQYTLRNGFAIGIGGRWEWTEFEHSTRDRSHTGFGPTLLVSHTGSRWSASADVSRYDIEPEPGSVFVPTEETAGRVRIGWRGKSRVGIAGYAGRNVVYTLARDTSYSLNDRYGVSVDYTLGWRSALRVFGEEGEDEYVPVSGREFQRVDDYFGFGGELQVKITENSSFLISYIRQEYESPVPGANRTLTTLRVNLNLGSGLLSPW